MLRKYHVVVTDPCYKSEIHDELCHDHGDEVIPCRVVNVDNFESTEYAVIAELTEEEADALMSDLRVKEVQLTPDEQGARRISFAERSGTFSKSTNADNGHRNWGLLRSNFDSNVFSNNTTLTTPFGYNLDGTGVDVVIVDTGVEPGHPEFAVNADGSGGSRVIDHDWTQYGYITTTPTGGFLGDCDGHGSHTASVIAGNRQGWAPGANIYSFRILDDGTNGPYTSIYDGRTLGLIEDDLTVWRTIRAFHNAKPIDPATGYKRPTVVNASYGYITAYNGGINSIIYRGTTYSVSTTTAAYGTIGVPQGGIGIHGFRYSALESEISATINAGVIVVSASGNDRHKVDIPGGLDYDNRWTSSITGTRYYHRGSTPSASNGVICVGCVAAVSPNGVEHKTNFSCTGPRIDIWAPGDFIQGAYGNNPYAFPAITDDRNSAYYLQKISGTSEASPQVAGLLACVLQARPWMNTAQCLAWLNSYAPIWAPDENYYGGSGYTSFGSLQGAPYKVLYQPFNSSTRLKFD